LGQTKGGVRIIPGTVEESEGNEVGGKRMSRTYPREKLKDGTVPVVDMYRVVKKKNWYAENKSGTGKL